MNDQQNKFDFNKFSQLSSPEERYRMLDNSFKEADYLVLSDPFMYRSSGGIEVLQYIEQRVNELIDIAEREDKGKLFERIRHNRTIIELNYKLMNLRQVQMSTTTKLSVVNKLDTADCSLDKTNLTKQLSELHMLGAFGHNYTSSILCSDYQIIRAVPSQ